MNDRHPDPAPPGGPLAGLLAQLDVAAPLAAAQAAAAAVLDRWEQRARALQGDREVNDSPQDEADDQTGAYLLDCIAEVRTALGLAATRDPALLQQLVDEGTPPAAAAVLAGYEPPPPCQDHSHAGRRRPNGRTAPYVIYDEAAALPDITGPHLRDILERGPVDLVVDGRVVGTAGPLVPSDHPPAPPSLVLVSRADFDRLQAMPDEPTPALRALAERAGEGA